RCRGDVLRFVGVETIGPACRDITEGAGSRADSAEDHHGRMLLLPALADIRASRLFAYRVERKLAHQPARRLVLGRAGRLDPQPVRLARDRTVRTMRLFGMAQGNGGRGPARKIHRLEVDGTPASVKLIAPQHKLARLVFRPTGTIHALSRGGCSGTAR